jgi:EAL domain-containing protein (putative c-di-GMP-specific phosphodiesterase class I)/AmiR/NasT family two-component response regulator
VSVVHDRIRVLIADDSASFREVLADFVAGEEELELVGTAENAREAVALARSHQPDVALLDVKMPGGGPQAARGIRACSKQTSIVALSAHEDERSIKEMLTGGAGSYLVKGVPPSQILAAIRSSVRGDSVLSGGVAAQVVSELTARLDEERGSEHRRHEWEERIRGVLRTGNGLSMVFQPIIDLTSERVVGEEALARFSQEPSRSPDVWFAEAAMVGRGLELEMAAVACALSYIDILPEGVFMSINGSPETVVSSRFIQALGEADTDRIVLEVTEHAAIADYPRLRTAVKRLRGVGMRLAIDDAGAGFASLRHILQLSPDFIKLDISLTRDIHVDPPQRALAAALVTFAREIGATITAEGVEVLEEVETMKDLGVELGQGFFLGRPGALPGN